MSRILVVDDEQSMREFVSILLKKQGHEVQTAQDGTSAEELLQQSAFDLVVTDLKMPSSSGLDILRFVRDHAPETQVILMTAFATTDTAVEAMKLGARDYITKPFKVDELLVQVDKALEVAALAQENFHLRKELEERGGTKIVGRSEPMRRVLDMVARVARARATVLVTGESGTGKELVARAIHNQSQRSDGPFVPINCGAIPENLIESEMFGHVKGAFTGAVSDREGLFAAGQGGTVFLDEIGELPMTMQVKLLRVLQEKRVKPVGSTSEIEVDVRVVAATNRDLKEMVETGSFREDLYYRLNVIQIAIPPLRDRREDIPPLVNHLLLKYARELDKPMRGVHADAMDLLVTYPYDGNVRELENLIERAVTLEIGEMITVESLPDSVRAISGVAELGDNVVIPEAGLDLDELLGELERNVLLKALERTGGVRKEAARLLGISFRSIRYRLSKYGLDDDEVAES